MSITRIGTESCIVCGGSGQSNTRGEEKDPNCKCFDCEGFGYRILVKNEEGYERCVTVSDYNSGLSESYF